MRHHLRGFCHDEAGATAVEYGLIVAILVLGIVTGVNNLGDVVNGMYQMISDAFTNAQT